MKKNTLMMFKLKTLQSSATESDISDHECKQCPLKLNTHNELQVHVKDNHDRKMTKKKQKNKKK